MNKFNLGRSNKMKSNVLKSNATEFNAVRSNSVYQSETVSVKQSEVVPATDVEESGIVGTTDLDVDRMINEGLGGGNVTPHGGLVEEVEFSDMDNFKIRNGGGRNRGKE